MGRGALAVADPLPLARAESRRGAGDDAGDAARSKARFVEQAETMNRAKCLTGLRFSSQSNLLWDAPRLPFEP